MNEVKFAALVRYVGYLRDCIRDGVIDPESLGDWTLSIYACEWKELGDQ